MEHDALYYPYGNSGCQRVKYTRRVGDISNRYRMKQQYSAYSYCHKRRQRRELQARYCGDTCGVKDNYIAAAAVSGPVHTRHMSSTSAVIIYGPPVLLQSTVLTTSPRRIGQRCLHHNERTFKRHAVSIAAARACTYAGVQSTSIMTCPLGCYALSLSVTTRFSLSATTHAVFDA